MPAWAARAAGRARPGSPSAGRATRASARTPGPAKRAAVRWPAAPARRAVTRGGGSAAAAALAATPAGAREDGDVEAQRLGGRRGRGGDPAERQGQAEDGLAFAADGGDGGGGGADDGVESGGPQLRGREVQGHGDDGIDAERPAAAFE